MCTRWWPVKKELNVESLRLKPTGLKTGKTLISYSLDHNAIWNPQFPSNTMTELSRVPIGQESASWNIQFPFFVVDIYWFCNWSNVFSYILGEKNILEYIFWNIYWNFSYILEFSIIYIVFVIGQFFFSQSLAIIVLELYKHGCKDLLLHDSTKVVLILCWKLRKTTWISNSEIHKHMCTWTVSEILHTMLHVLDIVWAKY